MDSELKFDLHIKTITNKAMKLYGWLVRNLVSREKTIIIRIYKTLIRPNLEYASSVWCPSRHDLIEMLERIQRKVTKLLNEFRCTTISYSDRLKTLQLPTLQWRRNYLDLLQVHQILHGDLSIRKQLFQYVSEISDAALRRHKLSIYKGCFHSSIYKNHFVNRVIDQWNSLPDVILDISNFKVFKKTLKNFLLEHGKYKPFEWAD
jgi:hypothetical protein